MSNRRKLLGSFSLSFGKYNGKPIKSVPFSYLRWILRTENAPVADIWAVRQFLAKHSSLKSKRRALRRPLRQQAKRIDDESSRGFVMSAFPRNSGVQPSFTEHHQSTQAVAPVKVSATVQNRSTRNTERSANDLDEVLTERPSTPPVERKLTLDASADQRTDAQNNWPA